MKTNPLPMLCAAAFLLPLALTGCPSSNNTTLPLASPTPTPTAHPTATPTASPTPVSTPASQALFAADYTGNEILEFASPFTSTSTPAHTLTANGPFGVAATSSILASTWSNGTLVVYTLPLTSSSSPSAVITGNNAGMAAFDASGNLWTTSQSTTVAEYTAPFTSGEAPAVTLNNFSQSTGIAFDAARNLYVTNEGYMSTIEVFAPGSTTPSVTMPAPGSSQFAGVAVSGNTLVVADSQNAKVLVYSLPLSMTSAASYAIPTPATPVGVAFDSSGNLYVGAIGGHSITEFKAPLSATSQAVTIPYGSASDGIAGVAVTP